MGKADEAKPPAELKPKLLNLGAMNQADYGVAKGRPPACTLYSGLFVLYAQQHNADMVKLFAASNTDYFTKMQKSILDEGMTLYAWAKEKGVTSVLDGRINPDELQGSIPHKFGKMKIS